MARGIDVHCYYQRDLRWAELTNVNFAWVKVSDGGKAYTKVIGGVTYRPDTQVAAAKAHNIPVGCYHYAQPSPSPEEQANVLIAEAIRLNAIDVVMMLDMEEAGTTTSAFGIRFCNHVLASGFRPGVYMNSSTAKALRPDQWPIASLVIIIARYGAKPEAPGSAQYLGRYDVHQYASDGDLPGSKSDLDESYTNNHLNGDTDMELGDKVRLPNWAGTDTKDNTKTVNDVLAGVDVRVQQILAGQAGMAAALAAVTSNPAITPEMIEDAIDKAVAEHVQVTIGVTPTDAS
jgi:lysozyme